MKNKKLNVLIFGSTGMVGKGVLIECLESPHIESILLINRKGTNLKGPRIKEIIVKDFFKIGSLKNEADKEVKKLNACYFCLGVSSAGLSEERYHHLTYDLTLHIAGYLKSINPSMTFIYISGAGTDSSENGKIMWARVKGKTENHLLALGFKEAYMFRPGFIQPLKGVKSKTKLYRVFYALFRPFYFILKNLKNFVTTTETAGKAMIKVSIEGFNRKILETSDINLEGKG